LPVAAGHQLTNTPTTTIIDHHHPPRTAVQAEEKEKRTRIKKIVHKKHDEDGRPERPATCGGDPSVVTFFTLF